MEYPEIRNLDGVYFRVKRDDSYKNICFSDLTEEERHDIMKDRSKEWLIEMCKILATNLHSIGDYFDIYGG